MRGVRKLLWLRRALQILAVDAVHSKMLRAKGNIREANTHPCRCTAGATTAATAAGWYATTVAGRKWEGKGLAVPATGEQMPPEQLRYRNVAAQM